jgi:hypothetical protein
MAGYCRPIGATAFAYDTQRTNVEDKDKDLHCEHLHTILQSFLPPNMLKSHSIILYSCYN